MQRIQRVWQRSAAGKVILVLIGLVALVLLFGIPAGLISALSSQRNTPGAAPGDATAAAQVTILVTIYAQPTSTPEPTSEASATPQATPSGASPSPTATVALTPEAAIVATLTVTDTNDYVNVRSGPAITHTVLGQLNKGQTAPITGKNAGATWYLIDFNGKPGWVYAVVARVSGDTNAVPVVVVPSAQLPAATILTATPKPSP